MMLLPENACLLGAQSSIGSPHPASLGNIFFRILSMKTCLRVKTKEETFRPGKLQRIQNYFVRGQFPKIQLTFFTFGHNSKTKSFCPIGSCGHCSQIILNYLASGCPPLSKISSIQIRNLESSISKSNPPNSCLHVARFEPEYQQLVLSKQL